MPHVTSPSPKKTLQQRWRAWDRAWRATWCNDLDAPGARTRAKFDMLVFDHGFLRALYSNAAQIAPQVFRSNQPSPKQLARWAKRGIKTVINLRGPSDWGSYLLEKEAAEALGLTLISLRLFSRQAPPRQAVLDLLNIYASAERPLLLHCKSGADRAGLGAALFVLSEGGTVDAAKAQLSLRYMHVRAAKTGVLLHFLNAYDEAHRATGVAFRDWVETEYDENAVTESFVPQGPASWIVDRLLQRE